MGSFWYRHSLQYWDLGKSVVTKDATLARLTLTAIQSATTFASAQRFVRGGRTVVEENMRTSSVQASCKNLSRLIQPDAALCGSSTHLRAFSTSPRISEKSAALKSYRTAHP